MNSAIMSPDIQVHSIQSYLMWGEDYVYKQDSYSKL